MTLSRREQFAMAAMQGLLVTKAIDHLRPEHVSERAVVFAEALIAALDKAEDADATATADGKWIKWDGDFCPVPDDTRVDLEFRKGLRHYNGIAGFWSWIHVGHGNDIIAYRIAGDAV